MRPSIFSQLLRSSSPNSLNIKNDELQNEGPSADYFGDTSADFGDSQYDEQTSTALLTQQHELDYLRGERQSNWDKAGNGLVNMLGKAGTTAAEGIVNPFYGTIAALTHTDAKGKWDPSMNSYYNNDFTKQLDKVNEAVESTLPFYSDKEEATDQGLAKLWHANTIFKDIMGGAGTSIGAALTGAAWSKAFSLLGKGLAVSADAAEAATLIEEAKTTGIALAGDKLKFVANEAMKKSIKDGARQGTIALMSATGEAGAEARETQKNIFNKLTTNPDGSPKQMTEGELEYAKMMSEQAGDAAFGMNLPVIITDNWFTFGKVMFGNKTNDFAKIANKTTLFDEATQTWKAVEKSKYADLGYRAGKIGTPMLSEGNQEMLQHAIGKTAEDYYVNKYYNPNAANFLDSFVKGMKDAYTTQEGWHAGIIGALSAGITSPGIVLATQGKSAFKDEFISNPEDKITAQAVESLNKYKVEDIRKKFVDNQIRQANLAEKKDEAIAANDDFNYHNANEDMIFSYVYNRLQNGKLNDTKEELNNFKDLTVEELKNVYGIDVNVENKASIEQLTGKGAVQKFVQDRLDKIAKIEDTYNQVTKLFPNAHPDVKELLIYSAQGLENTKQRKTEVAAKITKILQENSEAFTSIGFAEALLNKESKDHNMLMYSAMDPKSFAKAYNNLDTAGKKLFKKQITEADDISPVHQEEILKSLDDVEKLKAREVDFTLTYNALKDPKNQAIFLNASDNLWGKFYDLAKAKDLQDVQEAIENEEQKPTENPTPVEETQASPVTSTTTEPVETTPTETPIDNTNIPPVDASDVTSNIPAATFGFTQPVQQKPNEEVKTTNDKHLMLNTPAEARDTQVLYTDKEGKQHLVGEYRTNEENQLDSFDDVRQALEYFKSTKEDKSLVHFIEVNGFVMLQIANVNISTISKYGGSPEQKAISALFYNPDGSIKSLEEINNLYQAGVIQLDLTKHLNTLLKDDVKPTLTEVLPMLYEEADTVKLKKGNRETNVASTEDEVSYENELSELQSDIAEGLHIEMVVDGRVDVIKVKTKTNDNPQQSFDEVIDTITNSQGDAKVIKEAIDKFNDELFFALEPIKGVVRKFQLNYSVKTNTFYFTLQTKDKNTGSYSAPVQMKNTAGINILNNIHPSILSAEYVIDQLADSNVNKNVKFSAKNIRYSSFINEEGETDTNKLEVYIDPNGLFKYGVQFSINAEAKPLVTTTVDVVKPTFIKSLPQENLVVIEPDAMRVEFTGNINDKSKDKEIYIEAANRAVAVLKANNPIDVENLSPEERLRYYKILDMKKSDGGEITLKDINENPTLYQITQNREQEAFVASEKTIRDLAAKIADRIGMKVVFESDRTKQYKGKIENNVAYINLAYATLDTPIHEILGHPIIRVIKNKTIDGNIYKLPEQLSDNSGWAVQVYTKDDFEPEFFKTEKEAFDFYNSKQTQLYQNLLKELETGRGKEVLDRIKRDYKDKPARFAKDDYGNELYLISPSDDYTLEEQQEEAIVELLGLMTAEKLDKVKDGKLISLLKRLLKEMKQFVRSLLNQREVEIDKLPDNMTLGDLSDLLAYSNSKLILPGYEVEYTTPDNQKFKTYQEASKHISELAKQISDVDLDGIIRDFPKKLQRLKEVEQQIKDEGIMRNSPLYNELMKEVGATKLLLDFIEKNKEYEQSKEIIEEWKKVNNIQYNPEEVYSRGQGFYHSIGAYSNHDLELILQNILEHFKDNNLAGGTYDVSAFTKPTDKTIRHIEKSGVLIEIFPESKDINWASNIDVFSGSTLETHEKFSGSKLKKELAGVSESKYPSLSNINTIQPNLANIIDELNHDHNELGITLTGKNFRFAINEKVLNTDTPDGLYWKVKKLVDANNKILDQKYGKLVKPEIKIKENNTIYTANGEFDQSTGNNIIKEFSTKEEAEKWIEENKEEYNNQSGDNLILGKYINKGIQPTQTNKTLKESIESVKSKVLSTANRPKSLQELQEGDGFLYYEKNGKYFKEDLEKQIDIEITKEEYEGKKEYTEQALINTKIAILKEIAKKYPRSLIRSEVKSIKASAFAGSEMYNAGFDPDELPFQKLSKSPKEILQEKLNEQVKNNKRVVLDTTNLTKDKRLPFIEAIKKAISTANIQYKLMELNAELTALEEDTKEQEQANSILAKLKQAQKEATSYQDLLNQQQLNINEESDPDPVFSVGLEESTGITQSEIDAVKTILPRFISIEDITTIANNLKVKGIPYGVFKNKVIYLNKTKGKPGTTYHEAFHAVFRTMLNDSQIEKYYNAASKEFKKSGKNMKQEIEKLRSTVASYTNKSETELENLVLEEFMADKFMDYSMNKNQEQTGNLLKQLFFKIKNFFKELFNIGEELDMFYDNILKGKFANSQEVGNTYFNITDSVFKLLPKKNNAQENGFFNASESRKIIGYFAIKIHKAKLSGQFKELTDEELLDKFIAERIQDLDTKGLAYGNSIFASNPEYAKELANKTASEKYLYDKNSINNAKIRPYDVLKSSVNDKLAIFKYKTAEEANEEAEGGEEATHMKDTFGSQDSFLSGGHDSLSQTIKKYVAFTTRIERDEVTNEDREVGIDEVALYNGLTSILADTAEERMIAKLYDATESNSNIKAFYEQLITDLGIKFDPETRTTSYPTNAEAFNITRALLTNFKNSKATQIDVLVGESWVKDAEGKNTKVKANTWVNANKNDAKKISLERWKTKVTYISRQKSIKEFQKNFNKVPKIVNNYYKGNLSLDAATKQIKELLDTNGITLTSIYIKISLAKQKALVKPDDIIAKDKNFISIYDTTEPIDFNEIFGSISGDDKFSISEVIKEDLKALFDEKDGVLGRLGKLAENNAKFDESIANFSFTNAEGKKVYEIIKPSYVLSRPELYKKDSYWESVEKGEGLTEVEKKNTYFLKDNYLVTKHKDLLKNLKINILSGFRHTTIGTSGKSKDGVTFGSFDDRTYLLSAITLYHNKGNKEVGKYMFRQNEASSTGYVAELPKIDIGSVAGQQQVTDYFLTQVTKEWNRIKREKKAFDKKPGDLKGYNTNFNEEALFNPKETGRAFDFTEFQYLRDTLGKNTVESNDLYEALVKSALDTNIKELTPEQITAINKGVRSYLTASFEEFKKTVDKNQIRFFLTDEMKGEQSSFDSLLWEFYVNDYIMSNSLNELMDGDYALSRKDKVDISKRNRGAMASGPDFGRGTHTSAIIKDIDLFTTVKTINNKIQRVESSSVLKGFKNIKSGDIVDILPEDANKKEYSEVKYTAITENNITTNYEVKDYTSNDAMSYASQFHMMMGAFRLGRVDGATIKSYKDIIQFTRRDKDGNVVRNINIGDKSQKALSEALASLNSKKTIVFDGINGQYLKMSELGFIRSAISYIDDKDVDKFTELTDKVFDLMTKDDYESNEFRNTIKELTKLYKPLAGMEYWHKLANNMDLHGIDHLAVESASKGATRSPQDSQASDLDLSKSKFNVSNSNKRLQVETPTGKKEIVTGSQILTLIASELKDNEKVNGITLGQLRKEYNEAIASTRNSSFKRAMSVIKKLSDGTIDKSELDEVVKRALAASGADEQLLEFFDTPLNYNMVQMIVKAEQVILSHFSKGVLSQKVNGDKVSLVTDAGINVVREISTGRVISHHEIVKNPSVYSDTTKYTQSKLRYNVEEGDLKYSECMLSQTVLTRHGLKIGDVITPEMTEVLKMLGYRIPTGDKQSAMSLKVVSLLPDYYNGIGIFPSEIVHLSGADFDIDSEFIQMPYFWYKKDAPTVPIKYGSEKSVKDAFEGFKFYNLNYDKDFSRDYKELLSNNYKYRSLKKAVKQVQAEIDEVKGEMEIIENNIYMQVSTKYGLPFTEKDFIAKGKKPNAVLNNEALDRMISMLANNHTAEIANNTTSTDALKSLVSKMKSEGFIKESESKVNQKNKSASDINGKFDANSKNSAGKNGIGIAANKIQQFALLMSKVGDKVVKFNDDAFKFEIANETGGKYSAINKDNQRIADNLNILLNVFTDNAKDPIAGELNIQFELLGGFTELIMQGMSFENAVKFINLPIIQEYGKVQKALKSKVKIEIEESFNKNNAQAATIVSLENEGKINTEAIELVNKTAEKINPEQKEITLKQIENILLGKEFTKEELDDANDADTMSVQYQALAQFIKVQEQYNVMATLNTFLTLNQGLDTSFTELNFKLHKAIDTWGLNDFLNELDDNLNIEDHGLSVGKAHIDILPILKDDANTFGNIQRALEVSKEVGQKIFIEQTELFNKEFNKLLDNLQDKFSNVADNVSDVSREFLGYVSVKAYVDELESLKNEVSTKEANKQAIQKRLDSLNLGLIFNDLAGSNGNLVSQLELLKSNPATKDNYIIKYFTIKENIIDTKSFVKESNKTISLLIDSVKSLYFDNKTQLNDSGLTPRDFVDNMLSYLMVKDNMQFKNNSVAKYLPVNMFNKYSSTLDELVKGLVTKNTSMNFAEVGYNFRKMYVTNVNTSYGAMQIISLSPKDNTPVRLNGKNLEFAINTESVASVKSSNSILSEIFSKLLVKKEDEYSPAFKFPQFIKVRIGVDQYKIYELDSFTNNAKGFTNKKDNFLNYIDASQGVKHNLENAYAAGEKATYKPLTQIGVKDVSVFFPGTYDKAKELFDQVKPEEVNKIPTITKPGKFIPIEEIGKPVNTNPYAMTSELANDISTEVNASEVKLPEEKSLKVKEKDVTLDSKKNLLAMVNSQELFIEGKEFTEAQYQKLRDRINAAKTMNELMALEENITKCM